MGVNFKKSLGLDSKKVNIRRYSPIRIEHASECLHFWSQITSKFLSLPPTLIEQTFKKQTWEISHNKWVCMYVYELIY